ncbi:MAG: UrcA family protein [Pseudomonadota bacterium]
MIRTVLIAALLVPSAAFATDDDYNRDVQVRVISIADLDLSSGAGMDRLIRKLRGTIDGMCGGDEACRDQAWLSADWQVARETSRATWRRRIAEERANDWRDYRRGGNRIGAGDTRPAAPPPPPPLPPPPRLAYAPVPDELASKTGGTRVTVTTTVTLVYRTPPPDYRATWTPR